MDLRALECVVAVAEEASFTRAASRLHLAQPGVSAHIRRLEDELGHPLFDRAGPAVRLTEVGAAMLPYARAALAAAVGARQAVQELTGLLRGRVVIGMVVACGLPLLPDLLAAFHRDHPAVEMSLSEGNSAELVEDLRAGRLDLAVIGLAAEVPEGIAVEVVADEALVAAVRPGDDLAACARVRLASLGDRDLICLPRGTGVRAALDAACAAAGFEPHIPFEASDPRGLVRLAARGLGVAILPASLAAEHAPEVRGVEIVAPRLRARLALAWRTRGPQSPAADALIHRARAAGGEGRGECPRPGAP